MLEAGIKAATYCYYCTGQEIYKKTGYILHYCAEYSINIKSILNNIVSKKLSNSHVLVDSVINGHKMYLLLGTSGYYFTGRK